MIMKIFLTLSLVFIMVYYLTHARRHSMVNLIAVTGAASGLMFIWNPELSTDIAVLLGIGRGADMIFYSGLMIAAALFLGIYVRLQAQTTMLTELVRSLAIAQAQRPAPDSGKEA